MVVWGVGVLWWCEGWVLCGGVRRWVLCGGVRRWVFCGGVRGGCSVVV